MLIDGEIDLMSDVSYTEERSELMLFPSLAMGEESYYVYIDADNADISSEDLQTFNGKKVGVNKDSIQEGMLIEWAENNGIAVDVVEMTGDEAYSMEILAKGEIDAMVSIDGFGAKEKVIPVCKVGSSDYFFAVNKDRPDLLNELNSALAAIQDEDPYFNQRMFDEYIRLVNTNAFLSSSQESWLSEHGTIRVGYRDDYLPFCAFDKTTGELTGALKNFLAHASNCLKNAEIRFEAVPYRSADEAMTAMKNGEIDCVFPVNLSSDYCERNGIMMLNKIMQTEMNVMVRANDRPEIAPGKELTVAVNDGNTAFETYIMDHFPEWKIVVCDEGEDCFRAVALGEADCALICDYRVIIFLLFLRLKSARRVNEQQKQIEETLRRELEQKKQLQSITKLAFTDYLTGVQSKNAYAKAEEEMDRRITNDTATEFAMVLFDLNDLKKVNDTKGHEVGDKYIKEACRIIRTKFEHSSIYRIGGEEFVAVLEGEDYANRAALLADFEKQMDDNLKHGGVVVASGCAVLDPKKDKSAHAVLERTDAAMYERKKKMKNEL